MTRLRRMSSRQATELLDHSSEEGPSRYSQWITNTWMNKLVSNLLWLKSFGPKNLSLVITARAAIRDAETSPFIAWMLIVLISESLSSFFPVSRASALIGVWGEIGCRLKAISQWSIALTSQRWKCIEGAARLWARTTNAAVFSESITRKVQGGDCTWTNQRKRFFSSGHAPIII